MRVISSTLIRFEPKVFQQLEEMQRILGTHDFLDFNLEQDMAGNTRFAAKYQNAVCLVVQQEVMTG